jgi:hypothetical protein
MELPTFQTPKHPPTGAHRIPPFVRARLDAKREAQIWRFVALGSLSFALLIVFSTFRASRPKQLAFVLGGDGTLVSGPLTALSKNQEFFRRSSIYAAQAALQRTEDGLDLPELVQLYYDQLGHQNLRDHVKKWQDDMKRRRLSWKPILRTISEPIESGPSKVVEVKALLRVSGVFSGRALYEEREVKLLLHWGENHDFTDNGNYPWKVHKIEFVIGAPH